MNKNLSQRQNSDNDWSLGNSIIILEEEVEDMVEVKKRKRWSKK